MRRNEKRHHIVLVVYTDQAWNTQIGLLEEFNSNCPTRALASPPISRRSSPRVCKQQAGKKASKQANKKSKKTTNHPTNQHTYSHHISFTIKCLIKLPPNFDEIRISLQIFQTLIIILWHLLPFSFTFLSQWINHVLDNDVWIKSCTAIFKRSWSLVQQIFGQVVEPFGLQWTGIG